LTKLERAAHAATNGQRLYYVGYASDVPKRVRQHVGGAASGGAKYTNMFEPQALVDVSWYMTEGTARAHERRRAEELTTAGESNGYAE
jgi:predicted GIY-YIG superfamily endonuclease